MIGGIAWGASLQMTLRNTIERYGRVAQWLHWLIALAIFALYGLGLWIDALTYNDSLYQTIPHIHESAGILLVGFLVYRFIWRLINIEPADDDLKPVERLGAKIVHWGFYPLILAILVSGYLISTADGRAVSVFGWFDVPATLTGSHQEDVAGEVHEILAHGAIALAALHAIAALKHHFIDGGASLRRMMPPSSHDSR